jgi:hypothetical protein
VTHLDSVSLEAGDRVVQRAAIDNTAREAFFAASWSVTDIEIGFALKTPSGKVYLPDSGDALHFRGSTHAFYRVDRPEPGTWELVVEHKGGAGNEPSWITTAAMADSDVQCHIGLDPRDLHDDKILVRLQAQIHGQPLAGGQAIATATYPTQSIDALLDRHAAEIKEIKLDPVLVAKDADDENLVKLGILTARYGREGKDILERERVKLELRDDGQERDPKAGDGIYTAFFEPKQSGVAGNYQIQVSFQVEDDKLGTYACTKLLPVHVPRTQQVVHRLSIKDIVVRRNAGWKYIIIGAYVVKADGTPATPRDGVTVEMTLAQRIKRVKSGDLPYYAGGGYYIWRCDWKSEGLRPGTATVHVRASLRGLLAAQGKRKIQL